MIQLDNTSLEELRSQLDEVEEKVPTQRVLAAIGRKLGSSTKELAELHDVSGDTIRNWLNRFKQQPIEQAPYDDARSGRPPKLSDEEKEEFIADLHESPEEFGYDRQVWFPLLAYHHLKDKFDVEYSLVHIRRMMREAGLSWRTARPRHYDADPEEEAEYQETVEKKPPT
jgi:transposase